jgi:hypothetical protein
MNRTSVTFLKIRSHPCSWWSRCKTMLPPPCGSRLPHSGSRLLPPRRSLKPPWVAMDQISYSCGVSLPWTLLVVAPSSRCPCDVHPKSQSEVYISCSGLVTGCCSIVVGNDQVASCSSRPNMEVVKSIKSKPPEVVSLVLPLVRVASGRHHRKVLLAARCLRGTFFPNTLSLTANRQGSWSGAPPSRALVCSSPSYPPRVPVAIG